VTVQHLAGDARVKPAHDVPWGFPGFVARNVMAGLDPAISVPFASVESIRHRRRGLMAKEIAA